MGRVNKSFAATLPSSDSASEFSVGALLSESYKLVSVLGHGAMGSVYEAKDLLLQRSVAVKVPIADTDEAILREARALAGVQHASLPVVYHLGNHRGRRYVVLELIRGVGLDHRIERSYELGHPILLSDAIDLLSTVADALHAIHECGAVHRDVKPANIILAKRGPILIDFGLALAQSSFNSGARPAGGTPLFMAPELIDSSALPSETHLADLYALGVTAFELLTGQFPFNADSLEQLWDRHRNQAVPDVRALRPDVPDVLASLVTELLAKKHGHRPQSAEEVVWRLRALRGQLVTEPSVRPLVLIVDDDPDIVELLQTLLSQWAPGAEIQVCTTGGEAIAALEQRRPRLLLLDMALPDSSGVEVMMHVNADPRRRPAATIAISGTATDRDVELLRHLGVHAFVPKGIHFVNWLKPIVANILGTATRTWQG